ncbi:CynX/NimT family MFS transporter [Bacillus sp. FJAT-26390]|uniref:MFS transporter n=1 Tax=Bacillus sp. FJAT-26390 TaxID=1743142 RepID=UPI000807A4C5|nr:MFS transporter [Bacillus sp. FJAT-26390]OBZ15773.1 MFS transporter [Bacillus sp. FJAT-26390]
MRIIYLILALVLAALNLRPSITSIPPLLGTIQDELGISGSMISLLTSLPVLCMGIFAPLAVKLNKRWGTEGAMLAALLLIGIGTSLRLIADTISTLLATSFLTGVGIAIAGPLLSGFIKRHFPSRASAMVGVYSTAMVFGAVFSIWLSVPLQKLFRGSWNASLSIWALLAIITIPVWMQLAATKRREQHERITVSIAAISTERTPLRNLRAWILTLFFGLMAAIFYSITTWFAPAAISMGYTKETAGSIQTLLTLISLPATLLIPIAVQRFQRRLWWLIGCSLLELIGILMLNLSISPWLAAIPLGIGSGGLFPIALMLPIDETRSVGEANAWSAMVQSGGYILGAAGPILIGRIHDITGSFVQPFYLLGIVIVLQIAVQVLVGNRKAASHLR